MKTYIKPIFNDAGEVVSESLVDFPSPITAIRNVRIFQNGELSNDDYHDEEKSPGISSSGLYTIYDDCEAVFKYAEREDTKALDFGTASHAAMLEPILFDEKFIRDISKDDDEEMITSTVILKSKLKESGVITLVTEATKLMKEAGVLCTAADIKAHLKEVGIKVASTANLDELVAVVTEKCPDKTMFFTDGKTLAELAPQILAIVPDAKIFTQSDDSAGILEAGRVFLPELKVLENLQADLRKANPDKTVVKADDYDDIMQMRQVMFGQEYIAQLLHEPYVETSILCDIQVTGCDEWIPVKIRPDIITGDWYVPDYKTTRDVRPENFGRLAHEAGYWLRQAFVTDVLDAALDVDSKPALLAQGKSSPFIPVWYNMAPQQIAVGREQYLNALIRYINAEKSGVWPAYADGPVELTTPEYIAKKYGI